MRNQITYSDYVIVVDESGDHGLASIDRDYPVFVLDFCIFRKDHYGTAVVPKIQAFRFAYFGHHIIVLHEHDIRKQKPPFLFLKNRQKRDAFMDGLNRLIAEVDFTRHCQVNRNSLFLDATSILARRKHQRLSNLSISGTSRKSANLTVPSWAGSTGQQPIASWRSGTTSGTRRLQPFQKDSPIRLGRPGQKVQSFKVVLHCRLQFHRGGGGELKDQIARF